MDAQPKSAADRAGERFAYYMVRIQTNGDTRMRSSGVVERLGTGLKRSFSSMEALVRLLTENSDDVQNMKAGTEAGNESSIAAADLQYGRYVPPNKLLEGR